MRGEGGTLSPISFKEIKMTIFEAISKADEIRNNRIDERMKIDMLSELDGRILK